MARKAKIPLRFTDDVSFTKVPDEDTWEKRYAKIKQTPEYQAGFAAV